MGWIWLDFFLSAPEICGELGISLAELKAQVGEPNYIGPNPHGGEVHLYDIDRVEKAFGLPRGTIGHKLPARWKAHHGFR